MSNLDASGKRLRLITGVVSLLAGVLILPALEEGWRALLFVPFLLGFLGLLQGITGI